MQRQMQRVDAINQPTRNFIVACTSCIAATTPRLRETVRLVSRLNPLPSFKSHLTSSVLLLNYWMKIVVDDRRIVAKNRSDTYLFLLLL